MKEGLFGGDPARGVVDEHGLWRSVYSVLIPTWETYIKEIQASRLQVGHHLLGLHSCPLREGRLVVGERCYARPGTLVGGTQESAPMTCVSVCE
jgi:hypothetical protein